MKKIPTVYVRDPDDRPHVTATVNPECQWVLDGEGVPRRKYDGHCVMFDGEKWWSRREVKQYGTPPAGWKEEATDQVTGKRVGWEPSHQSPWAKYLREALLFADEDGPRTPGTYELIGPRINGNPEGVVRHALVRHDTAMTPDELYDASTGNQAPPIQLVRFVGSKYGWEGVVWHWEQPDGSVKMAKLKVRDLSPVRAH